MNPPIATQQEIKSRMLKNISLLWGDTNIDAVDPLVKILVESLAGELIKVNNTIETTEYRLLQNVASLLIPSFFNVPSCAHAILSVSPNECEDMLLSDTQFTYQSQKTEKVSKNIFSSLRALKVFDISIDYLVTEGTVLGNNQNGSFENIINHTDYGPMKKDLWVAIRCNPNMLELKDVNFYFNSKNENQYFCKMIQDASWYLNDSKLNIKKGLKFEKEASAEHTPVHVMEKEVIKYYEKYFIHISDDILELNNKTSAGAYYPRELAKVFSANELKLFTEPRIWIKLEFPVPVDKTFFNELRMHVNAFPVINRALEESIHRTKKLTNSLPIITKHDEALFSIKSVEDTEGNVYTQYPTVTEKKQLHNTYSINTGSFRRFDSEIAKKQIQQLIETIRDESAAFSTMGQDNLINITTEIDRLIAQLHQRVNKNNRDRGEWNSISLHHQNVNETFFIKYWITNGVHANGIPAGTKLNAYKGTQFKKDSMQLLTTTIGGQPAVSKEQQINAYKYAMLTNNKIITIEDIKACCLHEMKNRIDPEIHIQRGLVAGVGNQQGFVRCLEVTLKKDSKFMHENPQHNWAEEKELLQSKIEQRSSLNLTVRVQII